MPSPFPGMNPYLESSDNFHSFHEMIIPEIARALSPELTRSGYFARIDQHLFIHELPSQSRSLFGRPDIAIVDSNKRTERPTNAATCILSPTTVGPLPDVDIENESYLKIVDKNSRSVITVIEILSPSNKELGPDRAQYLAKHYRLLRSESNLIEIDLLRAGPKLPWRDMVPCDYYALVSRSDDRSKNEFWPVMLRDRLPKIPVPLRPGQAELALDLQEIVDRVYDDYGLQTSAYLSPPEPPLSPADATWAAEILAGAGIAPGKLRSN